MLYILYLKTFCMGFTKGCGIFTIRAGAEQRFPPIAVKLKGDIAAQNP